jgi:hypothetical protein
MRIEHVDPVWAIRVWFYMRYRVILPDRLGGSLTTTTYPA